MAIDLFKAVPANDEKGFNSLLKIVDNALLKMHKLIIELTEVRKGDHKYKAEEELLNFVDIVEDVRITLSDNIAAAGAILTSKINISAITFCKRKLRTIIYNLVSNAIKFRSPKRTPKIVITTKKQKDFMIISVKDNGIGINKKKTGIHIFKILRISKRHRRHWHRFIFSKGDCY